MKKVIVAILLVLPFLLIYFISFTGQILSRYTHIQVERISVINEVGDEYKEDDVIRIGLNDIFNLKIIVYPSLASNKETRVVNSNKAVCEYDEESSKIRGVDYGISTFIITSVDNPSVKFKFLIEVAHDKLEDFKVYLNGKVLEFSKEEGVDEVALKTVSITKGRSVLFDTEIIPQTALPIYKTLIWDSFDTNVVVVDQNGKVTAIGDGETKIRVSTKRVDEEDIEIVKYVNVKVSSTEFYGVVFNVQPNKIFSTDMETFDLFSIIKIGIDAVEDGITTDDLYFRVDSGSVSYVNVDELSSGKIKFLNANKIVSVKVYIKGERLPRDSVRIRYVP